MKFVRYDDNNLGLLTTDERGIIDLTDRLGLESDDPLVEYIDSDADASSYEGAAADIPLDRAQLESPVAAPGKVLAAPSNYAEHQAEMSGGPPTPPGGYFLKAPSSIISPNETIEIPFADRRVDHEIELAFLMNQDVKNIAAEDVLESVFGYTILLDISVRGDEDRSHRKSFDTFTVVGPCVATPDEIGDPQDLRMRLQCNGETRQDSSTENMILSCAEFVDFASTGTTIQAGDLITTGTPSGVAPLDGGDVLDAEIEHIGSMTVDVRQHEIRYENINLEK
jgi:2-keto-4-pentenoate hydratase/2-oxohepta-3-ene-1,7-dioic acid hydratase in catechol pathway